MIINPEKIKNKYACKKIIGKYLSEKIGLPVLSIKNDIYYFSDTPELKEALSKLPFFLQIVNLIR